MSFFDIISIAALCVLLSRYLFPPIVSFVMKLESRYRHPVKPFECGFCLSWWVGLAVFISLAGWWGIPYAALCAVCGSLIDRYL